MQEALVLGAEKEVEVLVGGAKASFLLLALGFRKEKGEDESPEEPASGYQNNSVTRTVISVIHKCGVIQLKIPKQTQRAILE